LFRAIKNVAKHSIIYGMSDMLSKAIGFVMIPLYTYYLTTADYGALELLDLVNYIVVLFLGMGIGQSLVRFYYEYDDEEKRKQVVSVSLIIMTVASLIVMGIMLFFTKSISQLVFKSPDYFQMLNIVFITIMIGISQEIPKTLLRIEEKSVLFVSVSLVKLLLTLSLNILFIVYFKMGVMGILVSGLISSVIVGVYLMYYDVRRTPLTFSFPLMKSMLKYGFPLVWGTLGMFVINFADRFIVQRLMTLSDVGIYSLAYKFGMLPNILILSPFLMIWAPKRFDLLKEPNAPKLYSVIFTYLMFIELFGGLGIAMLIKDVITLVAAPEYHEAYKYVAIILLSYILNGIYIFSSFGIHFQKKTRHLAIASIGGGALNIGANFLLIPIMGLWGAALATLLSYIFLVVYVFIVSQKLYFIPYEYGRLAKMTFTALGLFIIGSFINPTSIVLSIALKLCISLSFPFILYLERFFTDEELKKLTDIRGQIRGMLRSKTAA
jgi:O-antigen/teichoic acid export membrane protein